jgi:pimeloyl-ACP methyl ester carboxylesterase
MEHISSTDGTRIAFHRSGHGQPLILVHGTAGDHSRWDVLAEHLTDHFTLYAMDRRGRGSSDDGNEYSIEQEYEDIAALADSIGEPVNLYGHSLGAFCALGGAPIIPNLRRLVLYEPVITEEGEDFAPTSVMDRLQQLVDDGKYEDVVIEFMRDAAGFPEHEIEAIRANPAWENRVAAAHTLPREGRAVNEYVFDPAHCARISAPTLLLVGEKSPAVFQRATAKIEAAIPDSRVHRISEQGHAADVMAPEVISAALIEFLGETSS